MLRRIIGAGRWLWLQLRRIGPPLRDAAPIGADAVIATYRIVWVAFVGMATLPRAFQKTQAGALAGLIALVLAAEIALATGNADAITVGLCVLIYVGAVALALSGIGTVARNLAQLPHPTRSVGRAITDITAAFILGLAVLLIVRVTAAAFIRKALLNTNYVPDVAIAIATAVVALFILFRRSRLHEHWSEKFVSAVVITGAFFLGLAILRYPAHLR